MAKENVQKMMGVMGSVFAHTGKITKEDAMELSGLSPEEFEKVYIKAGKVAEKIYDGKEHKYDEIFNHMADEMSEYMKKISGFGIA